MKDRSGLSTVMRILEYGSMAIVVIVMVVAEALNEHVAVRWYNPFTWLLGPLTMVDRRTFLAATGLMLMALIALLAMYLKERRSTRGK